MVNSACRAISRPWSQVSEPPELCGEFGDLGCERSRDDLCGVAGREADEHDEAAVSFDEGRHDAFACTTQQVAFPVARHRTVLDVGRPVADVDHGGDLALTVGE